VPFPPGGVADAVARPVAEAPGRELKQTVIVDNRVGAGGALGMGLAARAPADGHTLLLMTPPSISILPEADKMLGRKPACTLNQFRPIARFTAGPAVLALMGGQVDAISSAPASVVQPIRAGKPPAPSWGSMPNTARNQVDKAPWMAVWPGPAIFLLVLAFKPPGDGLRGALDARS